MKCPNCGTENDKDAVFCKKCGTRIETQSDGEDISWVDKVDFTKGIDWGETDEQPEPEEEPVIEVDLSQKQRAQMWEDLQRKRAGGTPVSQEEAAGGSAQETPRKKKAEPKEEPELDVMPAVNRRRAEPQMTREEDIPEEIPADVGYDDEEDYDFDEYDYQEEETDGGRPPVGILVGIVGVVAAIVVMAIILFNVFSNGGDKGKYVPATGGVQSTTSGAPETTETASQNETTREQTTEAQTTEEETTEEETTVPETTEPETREEETTAPETTEETTQPDPDPVVQDGLTYQFRDGEAYVGKYTGEATEIYVASEVNGYPVRYIDADAFSDCYSLQKLYVPEGVVEIGENALYNCTSLSQIVLPSTLTKIGQGAFDYCPAFTIVGQEGTYAQQFADLYHVNFVAGSDFAE